MLRQHVCFVGIALLAVLPASAQAADKEARQIPPVVARLAACKTVAGDAARLACYDREAQVLTASVDRGEIKVIDREEAKTMRRSLFGFSLPKLGLFGGGKDDTSNEEVRTLDSTIVSLTALPRGRWQFKIAEGEAQWETMEAPSRLVSPKIGQKVEIEQAALGSYWIRFNGQNGVKGHRVN
jgi:hypothetical protein